MFKKLHLIFCFAFFSVFSFAQQIETQLNIEARAGLQKDASQILGDLKPIAQGILGLAMAINLVIVIYHLANNTGDGKKAAINWLVSLVVANLLLAMV